MIPGRVAIFCLLCYHNVGIQGQYMLSLVKREYPQNTTYPKMRRALRMYMIFTYKKREEIKEQIWQKR
mgnify:CR=1 FL=1